MRRYNVIKSLITSRGYKRYLEIGVGKGTTFRKIKGIEKVGVDVNRDVTEDIKHMTSDQFFESLDSTKDSKFDIIFIDGHLADHQVDMDIKNALKWLNKNGCIVLHHTNPNREIYARDEWVSYYWCGTVWKSIAKIRCTRKDLKLFTVDADWGCTVIEFGKSTLFKTLPIDKVLEYENFDKHRVDILNLIDISKFIEML